MKKIVCIILLALALVLSGCNRENKYGQCIGIADDKDPALNYKVDTWNAVLGIVFIETLIVPFVVVNDCLYCPVSRKNVPVGTQEVPK